MIILLRQIDKKSAKSQKLIFFLLKQLYKWTSIMCFQAVLFNGSQGKLWKNPIAQKGYN